MARRKPNRPNLKVRPGNVNARIERLEYLVEKLLKSAKVDFDWK